MGRRDIVIKKLLSLFQWKDLNGKRSKKVNYMLIIGLVGILLLIVSNIFGDQTKNKENHIGIQTEQTASKKQSHNQDSTANVGELEASYKKDLESMLERIEGISEVEVMVNLEATNQKVYEKNLIAGKQFTDENDKNGGTRQIEEHTEETQVVTIRQGDKETPLLIQTKKPEVRGVLIVAKGVDKATRKQWVVEAVTRVLGVPSHRVSVMSKN
ncbi:stage III sporulation protein AG [Ornithinibacillus gellani]|nr:stage III sporulation protein AG [Ornithinibacillus gellani]